MTAATIAKSAGRSRRARRPQKAARPDRAVVLVLLEQQRRDEEAREHEEQVDAEVPAARPREVEVVGEHREDREGAEPVERGEAPPPDGPAGHRARAAASADGVVEGQRRPRRASPGTGAGSGGRDVGGASARNDVAIDELEHLVAHAPAHGRPARRRRAAAGCGRRRSDELGVVTVCGAVGEERLDDRSPRRDSRRVRPRAPARRTPRAAGPRSPLARRATPPAPHPPVAATPSLDGMLGPRGRPRRRSRRARSRRAPRPARCAGRR